MLLSLRLYDMIRININIHTNLRQRDKLGSRQYVIWSICFLLLLLLLFCFIIPSFHMTDKVRFSFCQSICVICIYICVICLCNIGIYSLWTFKILLFWVRIYSWVQLSSQLQYVIEVKHTKNILQRSRSLN